MTTIRTEGVQPLHIGLNLLFMVPGETGGMEVYARELLPRLVEQSPDARFTAFVAREASDADGPWRDIELVTVPVNSRRRVEWVFGEQTLLPRLAARARVDLLHSLGSTAPAWGPFVRVVTVHDLNYLNVPEAHFGLRALGMRVLVPLAARTSKRVVVVSHATASDVHRHLRLPMDRIDVVPNGLGSAPVPPADLVDVRRRLGLGERQLLLSVSAKRPHKNLARLIEALAQIPASRRPLLVLPGYSTPHEAELRAKAAQLRVEPDVIFLGWLPSADLEALYALADVFVFPSLYEGAGLPVLEAMARGVPVACSNRPAMPEFAGDAALLFDPESSLAIADAIERLLVDKALARRLAAAGPRRAAGFTWEAAAAGTADSYRRALELDSRVPAST
jgi:glycosyltransferase involved in cell wall biosynthesis